jgi:diguanylate cyclase (GGDEF)-like protein
MRVIVQWLLQMLMLASLAMASSAAAMTPAEADRLLTSADESKNTSPDAFAATLATLQANAAQLTTQQHQFLKYLQAWHSAYEGEYLKAIGALEDLIDQPIDSTLRFRATATVVNVMIEASRYEAAFSRLSQLLDMLPQIKDNSAREQGLVVAALLYSQVGQYDLAEHYADTLISENIFGRGVCRGGQLKMEVLSRTNLLRSAVADYEHVIDACAASSELGAANMVRSYVVRRYIALGELTQAHALLNRYHDEVIRTRYPRLISEFDELLADVQFREGDYTQAQSSALRAVNGAVKREYTEPLASAYRLLYLLAQREGDAVTALAYHEKYALADKGYLDDVSARQLAYHKVTHELTANRLQIETLNRQNQLLELQRENNNLYIALLVLVSGFIGYWAYKTKLSQLHFMKLSRHDGLTGIFNRHHFIEQANIALTQGEQSQRNICMVLWDLDHFKAINDRYGHAAGDSVLKQTVAACQPYLQARDLIGRFGGEEFGVLLNDSNMQQAEQRSEQMRMAIAKIAVKEDGVGSSVSASFGVAATLTSGYVLSQLLADADAALYQAKRAGRNRVASFDISDRSAAA